MSASSFISLSNSLKYNKYINMPYIVSFTEYHVIRSISVYKFKFDIYCYEVVSNIYINGVLRNGFCVNHLFPSDFEKLIKQISNIFNDKK